MAIPGFREDGYLPEGLHLADEDEVEDRFGQSTPRRVYLMGRVRRWLQLARAVGARRLLIDGSFVTRKPERNCRGSVMIANESEFQAAQRELQYLREFLTRVEKDPVEPNKDLCIIGIYKKMYHLWEELDEYYQRRISALEVEAQDPEWAEPVSAAVAD